MKLTTVAKIFYALYCAYVVLSECPNWCNKRGYCTSPGLDGYCDCEVGYTGNDCSLRICPKSFDPLTIQFNERRRAIRLTTNLKSGVLLGKFTFSFANSLIEFQANANMMDDQSCINALLGLKSIRNADCVIEDINTITGSASYVITLLNYPTLPYENNIFHHKGNPALDAFRCNMSSIDLSEADTPYCEISDEVSTDIPLYTECGSHGVCNNIYGLCTCEKGFKGLACDDITDNQNVVSHGHDGPFFTGSLVHLSVQRESSVEFNLLTTQINSNNVTIIRGDKRIIHSGDAFVEGSIVSSNLNHASVEAQSWDSNFVSVVGEVPTNHFHATYGKEDAMVVSYDGSIVANGSLSMNGGELTATDGEIAARTVRLRQSLHVDGNAYINKTMFITNSVNEDDSDTDRSRSMLLLESKSSSYHGTMLELSDHSSSDKTIMKINSKNVTTFKIDSNGRIETSGLKMLSGGIVITSGGLAIKAGGLTVSGDLNVENGRVNIENQDLTLSHLTISPSKQHGDKESLLTLKSSTSKYFGSMINLMNIQEHDDESMSSFSFIAAKDVRGNSLFDVKSNGMLYSNSGAVFRGENGIKINHHSVLEGGASFHRVVLEAEEYVLVPSNTSYVVISDDEHNFMETKIVLPKKGSGINIGQLLIVTNNAVNRLVGDVIIPPMTTIFLIFNGEKWQSIDSLKTSTEELRNVKVLEVANDIDIGNFTLSAGSLRSTDLSRGAVPVATGSGLLIDTKKMYFEKGILRVPNIRVSNLLSDLDAKGNVISNAILSNPKFQDSSIVFDSVVVKNQRGVAVFNSTGHLIGSEDIMSGLVILKLSVNTLNISDGLDMNNNYIRNIRFDEKSIPIGAINFDGNMLLDKGSDIPRREVELVGIDSFGKVVLFSDNKQQSYKYKHVDSYKVTATEINLANTKSASFLSTDNFGNIIENKLDNVFELSNNLVMKNGDIILTENSKVIFSSTMANSILAVNNDGRVISASKSDTLHIRSFTSDVIKVKDQLDATNIDASKVKVSGDIFTTNIESTGTAEFHKIKLHVETNEELPLVSKSGHIQPSDSITVKRVTAEDITSTKIVAKSIQLNIDNNPTALNNMNSYLSLDKEGNVKTAPLPESYSFKSISVESIKSNLSESVFLYADDQGKIRSTKMIKMSADEISPPKLVVNGASDFYGSVYVEGSLNVHGPVVGSGPYMDSSDRRFKNNIENITGAVALEKVKQLQAVSYLLNTEDYPNRNFEESTQFGWIADSVETFLPELVSQDSEGFKAVSYARSTVLVAEALKELEAQHRKRIEKLENDIKLLMESCKCDHSRQ